MLTQETAVNELPKPQVFTAVTVCIALLNLISIAQYALAPESPMDMVAPTVRPVSIALGVLSITGLSAAWLRYSWGVYLVAGSMIAAELGILSAGVATPVLVIVPALAGLYLWSLHVGGAHSMWRQLSGTVGQNAPGMAYGIQPTMPPRRPATKGAPPPAPAPPPTSRPTTAAPAPPGAATPGIATSSDPLERLKRLAAIRDAGVITPQEFDAKKAELLKQL